MSPLRPEPSSESTESLEPFLNELYQRRASGIKLGLETTQALLAELGNPHRKLPVIHVAGTNGKGSVCAMIESVLRAAGFRTGLYISPHLIRFNERFQVNGRPISDVDLRTLLAHVDRCANRLPELPEEHEPTFFEFTTAAAFTHFACSNVDIAVVETGLGGRLDSTNVVDPQVTVITQIGLDHVRYLGSEIRDIAREKAGIIKPGRPLVCGALRDEAWEVIENVAASVGAPVVRSDQQVGIRRVDATWEGQRLDVETPNTRYPRIRLPLVGTHQLANLALAITAVETWASWQGEDIDPSVFRRGLESVHWPARAEVLHRDPLVVLDVAHNPDGAAALRGLLDTLSPDMPAALIAGLSRDKDAVGFFRAFSGRIDVGWTISFAHQPSIPPTEAAEAARLVSLRLTPSSLDRAAAAALTWARRHDGIVLITGSIYLAHDVYRLREKLGLNPPGRAEVAP